MADIFGLPIQTIGPVYRPQNVRVTFAGSTAAPRMIVQNFTYSYNKNTTRLFDLTVPEMMAYVESRPQGNMTIQHAMIDAQNMKAFMTQYGDICQSGNNVMIVDTTSKADCIVDQAASGGITTTTSSASYNFHYPTLMGVQASISVNDYLLMQAMNFMFTSVSFR